MTAFAVNGCSLSKNTPVNAVSLLGVPGVAQKPTTEAEFWRMVDRKGPDECWPWLGRDNDNRYSPVSFGNKSWWPARLAYYFARGSCPGPMRHSCKHRLCCNPAHLELIPRREMVRLDRRANTPADFWRRVLRGADHECWPWQGTLNDAGYGLFSFQARQWRAHRLAFALWYGHEPQFFVCHTCNNPRCCNPHHLYDGTPKENTAQAHREGRFPVGPHHWTALHPQERVCGERSHLHKLNTSAVHVIRHAAKAGFSLSVLADAFGVSKQAIAAVVQRKTWRHIPE